MDSLKENISFVHDRISRACDRVGRIRSDVTLVAVSKTVDIARIAAALDLGLSDFGENRPQELARKAALLPPSVRWHMIGHLQRNKIRDVADVAHCVHSVDSLRLLHALDAATSDTQQHLHAFLEVNISREPQKHGFLAEEVAAAVDAAAACPFLSVHGLMTVAEDTRDERILRAQFAALRNLRDQLGYPSWDLSMGMSHDFEIAIEEGATVVRVGSAIFGERIDAPHTA